VPVHFHDRASSKQLSRIAHVKRESYSRSLSLAPAQTGWREVATQVQYRLSAEQLDRCEAVGATLRATSRETNTGTRKQTRTRTQTNQLKGKRGIWTWVREANHDKMFNLGLFAFGLTSCSVALANVVLWKELHSRRFGV